MALFLHALARQPNQAFAESSPFETGCEVKERLCVEWIYYSTKTSAYCLPAGSKHALFSSIFLRVYLGRFPLLISSLNLRKRSYSFNTLTKRVFWK